MRPIKDGSSRSSMSLRTTAMHTKGLMTMLKREDYKAIKRMDKSRWKNT